MKRHLRVIKELNPRAFPTGAGILIREVIQRVIKKTGPSGDVNDVMGWIALAQDATDCGGVSAYFSVYGGFGPPYPETTGYLIPTMLNFANRFHQPEFRERARNAVDWLVSLQLDSGAFPGGFARNDAPPLAFDSGQILVGLVAAAKSLDASYTKNAECVGEWLCAAQSEDGSWQKFAYESRPHVYYTMVSRALAEAHALTNNPKFEVAARRNLRWAVSQQRPNGWFDSYGLGRRPVFLHFIAYTLQGLIDSAIRFNDEQLLTSAVLGSRSLLSELTGARVCLAGAYNGQWERVGSFECVTGSAQMSLVFQKLFDQTGDADYRVAFERLNSHLRTTICTRGAPCVRGAVKGSNPLWGRYLSLRFPNWAAKFTADALMTREVGMMLKPKSPARKHSRFPV